MEWFQEEMGKDTPLIDAFCDAFIRGDAEAVEEQFNAYLLKTISIRDTNVRKGKKENFYHGILLGLLSHREDWWVRLKPLHNLVNKNLTDFKVWDNQFKYITIYTLTLC